MSLAELHEVIQVAMGWQQHHLHVFGKGDREYGDNARDETAVTLASLIPQAGDWLGYRYDFGDCWDHDVEVEKVHRVAPNATYPRCSAGGRACPPEGSGGPEGYVEHMRALRHRKGWKYRIAKHLFGTTRWDPARWDHAGVNAGLAGLAKLWAKQAAAKAKREAQEKTTTAATANVAVKASSAASRPADGGPGNQPSRNDTAVDARQARARGGGKSPETRPETLPQDGTHAGLDGSEQKIIIPYAEMFVADEATTSLAEPLQAAAATVIEEPENPADDMPDGSPPLAPARWGYARLSPRLPDYTQVTTLAEAGWDEVVAERTGPRADRPRLRGLLKRTRPGDTLVIPTANSLAASITELLAVIGAELAPRGIGLEILSGVGAGLHHPDRQETADPTGRTGFGLFGLAVMAAQMEQATARELTREGSAAAAARGRKGGRPAALSTEALAVARERMTDGESITVIARHLGVGRSTLYRALQGQERP